VLTLIAATLGAAATAGPSAKLARTITGSWNMGQRARGLPVLMVIRQDDNLYPSFWCGVCGGDKFTITGSENPLTEDLEIRSTGGFGAKITHIPRKQGMERQIPGGIWTTTGSKLNVGLEFKEFKNWKLITQDAREIKVRADYSGEFRANDQRVPIQGSMDFSINTLVANFSWITHLTVNGSDLGLEGPQAGPLKIKVRGFSPTSRDVPPPGGAADDL
jgi:hypothetical protein